MANPGRRSLGSLGSNDISSADPDQKLIEDDKEKTVTISRILTVIAYMISVSTAAALLSAYYIFLWVPHPTDAMIRPTDSPFSLAQHGNSHLPGGSYYHYPKQNSYGNSQDPKQSGHATSAARGGSKKGYHHKTTVPPNYLPKPQYLRKKGAPKTTTMQPPRYRN